jgi:hypothetical protein
MQRSSKDEFRESGQGHGNGQITNHKADEAAADEAAACEAYGPEGTGTVLLPAASIWTYLKYAFLASAVLKFASLPHSENVAIVCLMADAASIAMKSPMSPFMGRYLGVVGELNGKVWYRGYTVCLYVIGRLTTWMAWGWFGYTIFLVKRMLWSVGLIALDPNGRRRTSSSPNNTNTGFSSLSPQAIDIPGFGSDDEGGGIMGPTKSAARQPPAAHASKATAGSGSSSPLPQSSSRRAWTCSELKERGEPFPPAPERFVTVCDGDERKAQKQFEAHLKWREENAIDAILLKPWEHFHLIKKCYPGFVHGKDRAGNVCYYEQLGKVNEKELRSHGITANDLLYHCNLNTEFIWNVLSPTEEARLVTVLDVAGVGVSVLSGRVISYIQLASEMQFKHYPERSVRIFIVNAPRGFDWTWSYVKKVLPQALADKIKICSMSTTKEQLLEFMDEDQIPTEYCGSSPSDRCVPLGQGPLEVQYRRHIEALNRGERVDVKVVLGLQGNLERHNMVPVAPVEPPSKRDDTTNNVQDQTRTLQERASRVEQDHEEMQEEMAKLEQEKDELEQQCLQLTERLAGVVAKKRDVEAKLVKDEEEARKIQITLATLTGERTLPPSAGGKKSKKWFGRGNKSKGTENPGQVYY